MGAVGLGSSGQTQAGLPGCWGQWSDETAPWRTWGGHDPAMRNGLECEQVPCSLLRTRFCRDMAVERTCRCRQLCVSACSRALCVLCVLTCVMKGPGQEA